MPDEVTTDTTKTDAPAEKVEATTTTTDTTDWKAEARKWESRAKENLTFKEKADKYDEAEAAKKSVEERLTDELNQSKATATSAQAELARFKIGVEKGLPANLIERLRGNTEDELRTDADELLKFTTTTSAKTTKTTTTKTQGASSLANPSDKKEESALGSFLRISEAED